MLGSIVVAALFPAAAAALVISLIPPRILGITGKALSLVATGLLLTLSLTHLLPEAIEEGSDIHDIGLTILITILVLVAIEMFFNSNHHSQTCPVCAANEQTKTYAKEHNFHPNDKVDTNAKDKSVANSMITSIVKPLNAANDTLSKSAAFDAAHKASCSDPNCSCHHEHDHDHQHAPASVCSCGQVHTIDPEHPDKRSTLHHLGHSHGFDLRGRDFVDATRRADENAALGKGSIKEGLSNGGAPILAGALFHSICDGIVLASSFMVDFNVGVAVTAAIIAHEMPQQLSNYVLMLNFGMSRKQGFIVNLTAMLGSLIGAIVFYNILDKAENILPFALAVAGGSFIYVALSDILPRINRPDNKRMMVISYSYLVIGAAIAMMLSHHH
ncbi:MAG: ZIP family metal transporter [Anaerobiospirillum succiniciproducens]|uniref:ZIP family metal transporter n=1 Tax=Anaerobiospirillum succiniciproducens TaxID=13335 RepID=UPI002A753FF7|nr:ZIP family metal transporter [Anaerobiospirillum succiniciproducens]MDY2798429.1 ZIP family metal transporter [Anaerobiospirillum succiniciproducens]